MTMITARDSAHDFIVKLSPSVCVAAVASLTGETAAQSFAYHGHGTADSDKSAVIHGLCARQHIQSAMHARSGLPPPPPPPSLPADDESSY